MALSPIRTGALVGAGIIASAGQALSLSGTPGGATVGIPYLFIPIVLGGTGLKSFTLSGSLPAGLSFSSSTGIISGIPTTASAGSGFGITVTDQLGASASISGLLIPVVAVLGPLTASFVAGAAAGTVITAVSGLSAGETLVSVNDSRLAVSTTALLVGLVSSGAGSIAAVVTTSTGRTLSIALTVSSSLPATYTVEAVGRLTRAGVAVAQLEPGAAISGGTNSAHFSINGAGLVSVSTAGQTAGLQSANYSLTITGSAVTTLVIPTEANVYDVSDASTLDAAITAALAASPTTDWLCRPRAGTVLNAGSAGGGLAIQNKVFSGSIADPNKGKVDEATINFDASVTVSGGSFTVRPRTPLTAKVVGLQNATQGRGLVLYGSSMFDFQDMIIENVAGADSYDRNIAGTDKDVTAVMGTSCILIRNDAGSPTWGKFVFRRCVIGAPDSAPYTRYPFGADIDQADEVIFEDCVFKNVYNAIRNQTCGFFTRRRCETKNFLVDGADGYPNLYTSTTPAFPYTEHFYASSDCVTHSPNTGPEFAGAHCDDQQIATTTDNRDWRVSIHRDIGAMDADQNVKETQGLLLKDLPAGRFIRGRITNYFGVFSTLNGAIFSRMDPADRLVLDRCTFVRSTKAVPTAGNAGPIRITVEKGFNADGVNVCGPLISNSIIGSFVDTTGSSTQTFTADPVPGSLGTRTLGGGGDATFNNNAFLSQLTPNTGAGDSYHENFPALASAAYVANRGVQFSIDYTSKETIRASAKTLFAAAPGSRASGKGAYSGGNPNRLMFAATRLRFPTVLGSVAASGVYQVQNFFFGTPDYDVTEPRFFLPRFYQLTTGATVSEFDAPADFNVEGVSIKVGSTWYNVPNSAFTMDASKSVGVLLDPILGVTVPKNTVIEGRIAWNAAAGTNNMIGVVRAPRMGEVAQGSTTSLAAKLTDGTTISGSNGFSRQYMPSYMVAKGSWDGRPVFNLVGDSIQAGANDNAVGLLSTRGLQGYWQRGLDDNTGSKRLAFGTMALEGSRPSDWSTRANWAKKLDAVKKATDANGGLPPFTHIGSNHGNNSISATDLYATTQGFWQVMKTEWPGIPIYHSEPIARTGSTNGYQSLAAQTVTSTDAYNGGVSPGQRWVFGDKLGKGSLTGDATAQARQDGWISGSFAPWRATSYDTANNRDKLSVVAFSTTLAAAYASNATTMTVTSASGLTVGDTIIVNPGGAGEFDATVESIAGNVITLAGAGATAMAIGTAVTASWHDRTGLHPGTRAHIKYATDVVVPWKVAQGWGVTMS